MEGEMCLFSGNSLDDLLHLVFEALLKHGEQLSASKGSFRERIGIVIELTDPRARLSRSEGKGKAFSALGELVWYLSGSDETALIQYYIPTYPIGPGDDQRIQGAYGPKLFGSGIHAQVQNAVDLLLRKPTSRKAAIQLFGAADLKLAADAARSATESPEIPCTCTIQFVVRVGRLEMLVYMRSNDAFLGLPHDVFCFTMIQETIARRLGVELGSYRHCVGSLHLYDTKFESAQQYLDEGWQGTQPMPSMPEGDPSIDIARFLDIAKQLRGEPLSRPDESGLPNYWRDLVRLIRAYGRTKVMSGEEAIAYIDSVRSEMTSPVYDVHLLDKINSIREAQTLSQ